MRAKTVVFLLPFLLGSSAGAAEFWQKKEYRRWSERECGKLLQDSPWAKRYVQSKVFIEPLGTESMQAGREVPPGPDLGTDPGERSREPVTQIEYQVQFRSALPIRRALVRLSQINQKYDALSPEQRQAFDAQAEKFLAVTCPETVVIHVAYGSNIAAWDRELARHWQTQTTERLRNFIFLIGPGGEKVPLLRYAVAGGSGREFQLVFPRQYEGRPLVGPQDKTLKLEFPRPSVRGEAEGRVLLEFKVERMLLEGAVVY
jgi:hypothetical protein